MKKLLLPIFVFTALAFSSAFAETKIVTVSMQKLFDGYYKSADADARLQSIREQAVQEAQKKQQTLQDAAKSIQAKQEELQNPMLSEDAKREKEATIRKDIEAARKIQAEYQQWEQETQNEINRRNQQIRSGLIEEISKTVNSISLKNYNADLVLDTSDILGSGVPTVLYADPDLDITDVVLVELNKKAPEPASEAKTETK